MKSCMRSISSAIKATRPKPTRLVYRPGDKHLTVTVHGVELTCLNVVWPVHVLADKANAEALISVFKEQAKLDPQPVDETSVAMSPRPPSNNPTLTSSSIADDDSITTPQDDSQNTEAASVDEEGDKLPSGVWWSEPKRAYIVSPKLSGADPSASSAARVFFHASTRHSRHAGDDCDCDEGEDDLRHKPRVYAKKFLLHYLETGENLMPKSRKSRRIDM